jgi:CRP/FNR family transcriptional regulator, cyclic AMP receptor protein
MKTAELTQAPLIPATRHDPNPVSIAELANLAFFEGLSPNYLAELRPHTKASYFAENELILTAGDLANRFYVIVSGRVAVESKINSEIVRVQELGPGEAAGFSWCFTPETLHFTVRALEPVKAIFFYGTLLREDCELDPGLGYELLRRAGSVMVSRLEALIDVLRKRIPQTKA